jgi:RNA polymerase sigma-70 factor (ECF subfamily)
MRAVPTDHPTDAESSVSLLQRAQAGEQEALELLMQRYVPRLTRWASGRLPPWARDIADTSDLVQETLLQTLKRLDRFEVRGDGALQAYLRQAVANRIAEEHRRHARRGDPVALDSQHAAPGTSPLEEAIGRDEVARYEAALAELSLDDRSAIIARVEMGCSYKDIASALGKPSANAARMAVERALGRLARAMSQHAQPRQPQRSNTG